MKRRIYVCAMTLFVIGLMISTTSIAFKGRSIPDPDQSFVTLTGESAAGMTTCPQGDGAIYEYLKVTCRDANGDPIEGIQSGEFEFTVSSIPGDTAWFRQGVQSYLDDTIFVAADSETDANGEIRFTIQGDTSIVGNITIEVTVRGVPINDVDMLLCNSYDINTDGIVGLPDFGMFSAMYLTNDYRGDYDWNGIVGLSDFARFSAHYLHVHPDYP